MQVLVVGASRYSFQDKEDRSRQVEGCKVHYVELNPKPDSKGDTVGAVPASVNLPYSDFVNFKALPAVYALDMGFKIVRGKPQVEVIGVEYVSQASIKS